MEIHKPHAAKTWREFLIEIGTIVTGILIALALEQGLEALHEQKISGEAREAVHDEARQDLYWVKARARHEPCVRRMLSDVEVLLDRAEDHRTFVVPRHVLFPFHSKISTRIWDANAQAGRASLFSRSEQTNLSGFYYSVVAFDSEQSSEEAAWGKLGALRGRAHLSQNLIDSSRTQLAEARYYNWQILLHIRRAQQWARINGLEPSDPTGEGFRLATGDTCPSIFAGSDAAAKRLADPIGDPEDAP